MRATSSLRHPTYPAWKAAVIKALKEDYGLESHVMRERALTLLYIARCEPKDAADRAYREWHNSRPLVERIGIKTRRGRC
jgi:hypothetical protein